MKTIVGVVADQWGHAMVGRQALACPSTEYLAEQRRVPVTLAHRAVVGQLEHLELDKGHRLVAVATVDKRCNLLDAGVELWFSPGIAYLTEERSIRASQAELAELAICRHPASVALPPIKVFDGPLRLLHQRQDIDPYRRELLERAYKSSRSDDSTITVRDVALEDKYPDVLDDAYRMISERPPGKIWYSRPVANSIISVR